MCGIYFRRSGIPRTEPASGLRDLLSRRGPDSYQIIQKTIHTNSISANYAPKDIFLTFASSVLSLRGDTVVRQPLVDERTGSLLCWNGEAWKIGHEIITGNDGQAVFNLMLQATERPAKFGKLDSGLYSSTLVAFVTAVRTILGPFSFMFYDENFQRIFYARDFLGRRSLLVREECSGDLIISSVPGDASNEWAELDTDGIYMMDINHAPKTTIESVNELNVQKKQLTAVSCFPWDFTTNPPITMTSLQVRPIFILNHSIPILRAPALHPSSPIVLELEEKLLCSIRLRINIVSQLPQSMSQPPCIAVLFSGGVDCTLIARLIHKALPANCTVDLLNVAFENPRVVSAAGKSPQKLSKDGMTDDDIYENCPDRITGLSSYTELLQQCPRRFWRFISINIPYTETIAHRAKVISLIHPHNTEMDLSIAYALYFAARGSGKLIKTTEADNIPYVTPSRVIFSGLGADELFGGYTRHANAFNRSGYSGLLGELSLDFERLGKRNLGRDDRVTSHWGREIRYPFLDEDFVSWTLALPIWEKCNFPYVGVIGTRDTEQCPQLEPGKYLLRLLAWKLGIRRAALEKKRAIQFGTRAAKMMSGKTKGTEVIT